MMVCIGDRMTWVIIKRYVECIVDHNSPATCIHDLRARLVVTYIIHDDWIQLTRLTSIQVHIKPVDDMKEDITKLKEDISSLKQEMENLVQAVTSLVEATGFDHK